MTKLASPPQTSPPRRKRATGPLATIGIGLVGAAYLGLSDPHQGSWIPACPLLALTGLDCPLCGGSRAVHDLTRGSVAEAADHNALVVLAAPVVVIGVLFWLWSSLRRLGAPTQSSWNTPRRTNLVVIAFVIVLVVFAVVRNLPNFAFLGSTLT
jgi:hypothetical protein